MQYLVAIVFGIISIGLCMIGFWYFGVPLFFIAIHLWNHADDCYISPAQWEEAMKER